jgi:hypothetical protein
MTAAAKRGGARERNGHLYARVRYGRRKQLEFRVAWAASREQAAERGTLIGEIADKLLEAGRRDLVRPTAEKLAAATTEKRLKGVLRAVDVLMGGAHPGHAHDITVEDFARRYTSGELSRAYPDECPLVAAKQMKATVARLKLYILPIVRDVPVAAFTHDHARTVMQKLPPMSGTNRRHVAQIIGRLMHLAAKIGLITASPLPRGWLPKITKRKHYSCLYPREDAKLLGHGETSEAFRLFCGVLNREGMREAELLDCCEWQWNLDEGTFTTMKTKTDDPRMWAIKPDVCAAMRIWRGKRDVDMSKDEDRKKRPFAYVDAVVSDRTKLARYFRARLQAAGVDRTELFESTEHTGALRVHDMRATFVTVSLAEGRTETWIRDRTAHKSTSMIDRYRRTARQLEELHLGSLVDLVSGLGWGGWRESGGEPPKSDVPRGDSTTEECTGRDSNPHAFRRRNLNPLEPSDGPPDELIARGKTDTRGTSKTAPLHLPSTHLADAGAISRGTSALQDGSSAPAMRTRLEVDGEVLAETRAGPPEDVAGELAGELRGLGVPAVAVGAGVRVGSVAEVSAALQKCLPDRESVDLVTPTPRVTKSRGPAKAKARPARPQAGERRRRSGGAS